MYYAATIGRVPVTVEPSGHFADAGMGARREIWQVRNHAGRVLGAVVRRFGDDGRYADVALSLRHGSATGRLYVALNVQPADAGCMWVTAPRFAPQPIEFNEQPAGPFAPEEGAPVAVIGQWNLRLTVRAVIDGVAYLPDGSGWQNGRCVRRPDLDPRSRRALAAAYRLSDWDGQLVRPDDERFVAATEREVAAMADAEFRCGFESDLDAHNHL